MNYDTSATCKSKCDFGSSANLTSKSDHICIPCHDSCDGCAPSSFRDCLECNRPEYQFRIDDSLHCARDCITGQYKKNATNCGHCEAPCLDCEGSSSSCTLCDQTSELKSLYQNQCIKECPSGYTDINGECVRCERPCKECIGAKDQCTACDNSRNRTLLFNETCWETCPLGTCSKFYNDPTEQNACRACTTTGCILCDCNNADNCLDCEDGLYRLNGTCLSVCPKNYVNSDTSISCRYWKLADLGMVYFPFLITASLFAVIIFFGRFKRKKILVKGQVTHVSY